MYGYSMKARLYKYKYMYITIAAASMCLGCLAALKIRTTALKKERNITRVAMEDSSGTRTSLLE